MYVSWPMIEIKFLSASLSDREVYNRQCFLEPLQVYDAAPHHSMTAHFIKSIHLCTWICFKAGCRYFRLLELNILSMKCMYLLQDFETDIEL